jgi:hypothetical protein
MNKYGHDFFYFTNPKGRRTTIAYKYGSNSITGKDEVHFAWTVCFSGDKKTPPDRYVKAEARQHAIDNFGKRFVALPVNSRKEKDFIEAFIKCINDNNTIREDVLGPNCKNYRIDTTAEGKKGLVFKHV